MYEESAGRFCSLKRTFYSQRRGSAHIQEILPRRWDAIPPGHMHMLHRLAEINPIYHGRYGQDVDGIPCVVYEGDINHYWINSVKNPGSAQPFYPTWLMSAYMLARAALESGCDSIIDVGSGDGRIALCGRILGMDVCAVEIDHSLISLQSEIARKISIPLDARHADAATFDYTSLNFERPAIFTGGLPQMGDVLAAAVVKAVYGKWYRIILAGSHPRGIGGRAPRLYGWGPLAERFGLTLQWEMALPTEWTFDQPRETPYLCLAPGQTQRTDHPLQRRTAVY